MRYEREGETKWECVDQISDIFEREEDATRFCDENPACRYIENKDCSSVTGFQPCTSLEKSSKSCALQREGSQFESLQYQSYREGDIIKWECEDHGSNYNSHRNFDDAVKHCNKNPSCRYIEIEDCSGTEGYQTCSSIKKDGKSCAVEKIGMNKLFCYGLIQLFINADIIGYIQSTYCSISVEKDGHDTSYSAHIPKRPQGGCPADTYGCAGEECSSPRKCFCEEYCSWDSCRLLDYPKDCVRAVNSFWSWDTKRRIWVAQIDGMA